MHRLSRLFLAPESLLALCLQVASSLAQLQSLPLNQPLSLSTSSLSSTTFSLPKSSTSRLAISVALCAAPSSDPTRFFVTNNAAVTNPGPNSSQNGVFEIVIGKNGMGSVSLDVQNGGGVFAVSVGDSPTSFQIGVSDHDALHIYQSSLPLLGDTTSNQALLFSLPFAPPPAAVSPTYPNFALPDANLTAPAPPSNTSSGNFSLLIGSTNVFPSFDDATNSFTNGLPVSACALQNLPNVIVNNGSTGNANTSVVFRGAEGWRTQWLVGGLQPLTNYTAFVIENNTKVSGPIHFVTKSASFACPLVHSLPYCPLVSYSVPLPPPPSGANSYNASTIPDSVSGPLLSYMTNFTVSLLTFACGRDVYSPFVGCEDCQTAYRTWLCAVQLPRCGEGSSTPVRSISSSSSSRKKREAEDSSQTPLAPALLAQNVSGGLPPRNPSLPPFPGGNWTELLPCFEICNAVDRTCPPFLGFLCPVPRFTAGDSYGVGYIDGEAADGPWRKLGGTTGAAQDRWGNVWCNGPELST